MNATPLLAVYDEIPLTKTLLHNKLSHSGFEVLFSSSTMPDLFINLTSLVNLLLVHGDGIHETPLPVIRKVKQRHPDLQTVVYCTKLPDTAHGHFTDAGACRVLGNQSNFCDLVFALDEILFAGTKTVRPVGIPSPLLAVTDPFYSISREKRRVTILELLGKGKLPKEIAPIVGLEVSTVETYKKKMIHETHCHNVTELIAKAKDKRII